MAKEEVRCGECGNLLSEDPPMDAAARPPCSKCGSKVRTYAQEMQEHLRLRDRFRIKHKRKGVKGFLAETISGSEIRRSEGDYVTKERVIDWENDRYKERVVTEDGEVLRDVDEPLSQHRGHGSAKFNKR